MANLVKLGGIVLLVVALWFGSNYLVPSAFELTQVWAHSVLDPLIPAPSATPAVSSAIPGAAGFGGGMTSLFSSRPAFNPLSLGIIAIIELALIGAAIYALTGMKAGKVLLILAVITILAGAAYWKITSDWIESGVQEIKCVSEMRSEVASLASKIVAVQNGPVGTSAQGLFSATSCAPRTIRGRVEGLRFVRYNASMLCGGYCSGDTTNGCWIIEPVEFDSLDGYLSPISDAVACIGIPLEVEMRNEGGSCIPLANDPVPTELKKQGIISIILPNLSKQQFWLTLGISQGTDSIKFTKQDGYIGVCATEST